MAGFEVKRVRVTGVDQSTGYALVKDRLGKEHRVSTRLVRTGVSPREGEEWVIDRSVLDQWSFAALIGTRKPLSIVNPADNQTLVQKANWDYPGGGGQISFTDPVTISQDGTDFDWSPPNGPVANVDGFAVSVIGINFPVAGRRFWILADNGENYYGESISNFNWYRIPIYAVVSAGGQVVPWVWRLWCDAAVTVQVYQSFGMVVTGS